MGSMDCLTTVIGTLFFGSQELNPLIANLVNTNLPAFVIIKLAISFILGGIFVLVEKALGTSSNENEKTLKVASKTLRVTYLGITLYMGIVVVNNFMVLLRTL